MNMTLFAEGEPKYKGNLTYCVAMFDEKVAEMTYCDLKHEKDKMSVVCEVPIAWYYLHVDRS